MQRYRLFLFLFEKFSGLLHFSSMAVLSASTDSNCISGRRNLCSSMDHLAVQIARKVEQMRLDGRCTAVQNVGFTPILVAAI